MQQRCKIIIMIIIIKILEIYSIFSFGNVSYCFHCMPMKFNFKLPQSNIKLTKRLEGFITDQWTLTMEGDSVEMGKCDVSMKIRKKCRVWLTRKAKKADFFSQQRGDQKVSLVLDDQLWGQLSGSTAGINVTP